MHRKKRREAKNFSPFFFAFNTFNTLNTIKIKLRLSFRDKVIQRFNGAFYAARGVYNQVVIFGFAPF